MKTYSTLILCLIIGGVTLSYSSFAQPGFNLFKNEKTTLKSQKRAWQILNTQPKNFKNKATAIKERVIAQTNSDLRNAETDTTHYTYLSTRGSKFNFNDLEFGYNTEMDIDRPGINDLKINITAFADTIKNYDSIGGDLSSLFRGYYRADNQLDSIIYGYENGPTFMYIILKNTFNAQDYITEGEIIDASSSNVIGKVVYAYNNDFSKYVADSFFSYMPTPELTNFTKYTYGANNKVDSIFNYVSNGGNLELNDLTVMKYFQNGQIKELHTFEMNGTVLEPVEINKYTHFTNHEYISSWEKTAYQNGIYEFTIAIDISIGSNGFPDSLVGGVTENNNVVEQIVGTIEYNTANNPIHIKTFTSGVLDRIINFYYEEYDDGTTSIQPIENNFAQIYPNPFIDKINITIKETLKSISTISLTDILGRQIFEQNSFLNAGNNLILLTELPAGVYMLNITNPEIGQVNKKVLKK